MSTASLAAERTTGRVGTASSMVRRRRLRLATATVLIAIAIAGNLAVYTSLDQRELVVQAVVDIPAGTMLERSALRPIRVALDPSVPSIPGDELDYLLGRYAIVSIRAGQLVTQRELATAPVVSPGSAIVPVRVESGVLPVGLVDRSVVGLVVGTGPEAQLYTGEVVGSPREAGGLAAAVVLSVEVDLDHATVIAADPDIRLVLLDPLSAPSDR